MNLFLKGIKPCPWCKGEATTGTSETVFPERWNTFVFCKTCLARGPSSTLRAVAIKQWNQAPRARLSKR